jgi:hypothetical protein
MTRADLDEIASAYKRMAAVHYRPAAPSDGLGNITVPLEELDLDAEAVDYAEHWWAQEDDGQFVIGCPDWHFRTTMIFALEAARLCCGGFGSERYALSLLRMAVDELEHHLATHRSGCGRN